MCIIFKPFFFTGFCCYLKTSGTTQFHCTSNDILFNGNLLYLWTIYLNLFCFVEIFKFKIFKKKNLIMAIIGFWFSHCSFRLSDR